MSASRARQLIVGLLKSGQNGGQIRCLAVHLLSHELTLQGIPVSGSTLRRSNWRRFKLRRNGFLSGDPIHRLQPIQ